MKKPTLMPFYILMFTEVMAANMVHPVTPQLFNGAGNAGPDVRRGLRGHVPDKLLVVPLLGPGRGPVQPGKNHEPDHRSMVSFTPPWASWDWPSI